MRKEISVKEIMIILISVVLITICTTSMATQTSLSLGNNNNGPTAVDPNDYINAQTPDENTLNNTVNNIVNNTVNNIVNNTVNNATNNKVNNTKVYNTNNTTDLPQTGIEDYNIGILLIICVASAIYAYRKVNDYRSI